MAISAPQVTSLRITKLSSSQVEIDWDDVGSNFYYFVSIAHSRDSSGKVISDSNLNWTELGFSANPTWFNDTYISPQKYYKMRVRTSGEGFTQSDWVLTDEFQSFETNAYNIDLSTQLTLTNTFIENKLTSPTSTVNAINFNTSALQASLMSDGFQFSSAYYNLSQISNYVLTEDQYHEIQGNIEPVCVSDDRTMLVELDDVLYLFERYQYMVKVSNDKGQNWYYVKLLNDIVGNPVSRTCAYQSNNATFILGYNKIFYGRQSNDIRWSSDQYKFSDEEATFSKLGNQTDLPFSTELFATYATLPGDVAKYVEAFCCTNNFLVTVARDAVRYILLNDAPVDSDPTSSTFGEKVFEAPVLSITGNSKTVCSKMDAIGDIIFALITGEVATEGDDPTIPSNVLDSDYKGIYKCDTTTDTLKFTRVFGNTDEERRRIEHQWTMMSTDGEEVFFSSSDYLFETTPLTASELPAGATSGLKYLTPQEFHSDKHYNMMSFRANSNSSYETFVPGRMRYYAEPFFNWMKISGNRSWITTNNKAAIVYASTTYTHTIDTAGYTSTNRIMKEIWNTGDLTVYMPNITFTGFSKLADGVMIHDTDGTLVGYYEFTYRARDSVTVTWKPKETFFVASMVSQTRDTPFTPDNSSVYQDPDLRPLIRTMMPDSYLSEDTNFEAFCNYYLQYLSTGYGTFYNNLLNLIKDKYPGEQHAWQYLWSEMYKRNIYLSADIRDDVVKFFESRSSDFYSTKGTEASYKFLFKLLYNEDVEIDIESKNTTEYGIVITSDNISTDVVGRTIYTPTGSCNVTYIARDYINGIIHWDITIHNVIGEFKVGQTVNSTNSSFTGVITKGIKGKQVSENGSSYLDRSKSYYVMKIKSNLPTSRYRNDVLRFVHPVGFGFIGITLLTMFINSGLNMKHVETIIDKMKTYKWDAGLPNVWPDRVAVLDANGNIEHDAVTGAALYTTAPNAGQDFPLPTDYNSDNDNSVLYGQTPGERRKEYSPTFDQSAVTFSRFRDLVNLRLKDDAGNPRDPSSPTQVKIGNGD